VKRSSGYQFKYILFDLDETLYPKEAGLMDALSERMLSFMINKLDIPADDVAAKRRTYYQRYGTTLAGLMEDYQIDPQEYLRFVHDVDPQEFLGPSPPLADMLQEIPLRKAILTNASLEHCERILNVLQVRLHFDEIIDINALDFKCKPNPVAYQRALMLLGVTGEECILVEDSPRNLVPAKDLGMTTILIDETGTTSMGVDFVVPTIFHVGQVVKNLLPDSLIW
jgi:putative hydrolase of the HAD superfamily